MTDLSKLRHLLEQRNVRLVVTDEQLADLIGSIRTSRKQLEVRRAEVERQMSLALLNAEPQGRG